jgi:hypothetical protein
MFHLLPLMIVPEGSKPRARPRATGDAGEQVILLKRIALAAENASAESAIPRASLGYALIRTVGIEF